MQQKAIFLPRTYSTAGDCLVPGLQRLSTTPTLESGNSITMQSPSPTPKKLMRNTKAPLLEACEESGIRSGNHADVSAFLGIAEGYIRNPDFASAIWTTYLCDDHIE